MIGKNIKLFSLGLLGGMIPLVGYLMINNNNELTSNQSDLIVNNEGLSSAKNASFEWTNAVPSEDFVFASESSLNAVVHVTTKVETTTFKRDIFSEFFYGPGAGGRELKQYGEGSGSGVIVANNGYIVTNNHVIQNATEIQVTLNDNRKYDAEIVGTDPSTDIAVLKIKETGLSSLPLGNSDNINVGEWVLAVGNPFNLTSTVTAGIISAKARNLNLISEGGKDNVVPIESFIQTDAAVNPGNSGGALVNTKGQLIGINTAIASETGSYSGYSFAVPVNLVKKVMTDLIDYGVVQRGYLGVQIADITQEMKEELDLKNLQGVYVAKVIANGGAQKAGIKKGDVILKIGAKTVNSAASLQEEIGKRRPGDKIAVTVRNSAGTISTKQLVLRNRDGQTSLISKTSVEKNMAMGATFRSLSSTEKKELNITSGVKVKSLSAGKLKSKGLRQGMIVTKINNDRIQTVEQLTDKLRTISKEGVLLEIMTESGAKDYIAVGP
ncbi:MAG: trypsin-like peptidase domain-containing protein [Crocinitomicaceae bacterium]|nr:trypsin-like peptidase domain-containing protein [Crocinitomicaceae bacterium]MDG1657918.1 trypsin-like peptidase domain-containing protein [Crocinitomicaceae bacterium]